MTEYLARQNPRNVLVTVEALETMLAAHGLPIRVRQLTVYQQAFIHRSYQHQPGDPVEPPLPHCVPLQTACNETYEFLGDTILSGVVGSYLYKRYQHEGEGFLTKVKTRMVRSKTLGSLARRLGLGHYLLLSQHVDKEGGRDNMRILEDTFEAFIAAIYLDNGDGPLQTQTVATSQGLPGLDLPKLQQLALDYRDCSGYLYCQRLLINLYERYIDMARLVANDDNYKDQLQSQFQKLYAVFPTWTVLKEELSGLGRQYTIGVFDPTGFLLGTGRAYNKTEAEQQASRQALIQMGALKLDEEF